MSKKKGKNKPVKYQPFGDVLGVDTTFVQAAILLDKVSMGAYEQNDTETMLQVATQWLQLGALMHAAIDSEEKDEGPDTDGDAGAAVLGFGNTEAREKAEAENRERKSRG